jgi:hypothetical protein
MTVLLNMMHRPTRFCGCATRAPATAGATSQPLPVIMVTCRCLQRSLQQAGLNAGQKLSEVRPLLIQTTHLDAVTMVVS